MGVELGGSHAVQECPQRSSRVIVCSVFNRNRPGQMDASAIKNIHFVLTLAVLS